ncbi:MAG: TolC family protein [candidate division Zixibacteria bacterium]|nr:TolC family protein [candidate division Zixibacteria bacterium]
MLLRYFTTILLILFVLVNFCQAQQRILNLNLDQCLKISYENNKTLLQLEEKINSAKYQIDEARSGFYPQFSFNGSYTRLGEIPSYDMGGGMKFKLGTENNYNLSLSCQQPLFTWGKIQAGYDISKYNFSLTREEYRKIKQDIKFGVVNLFYNILLAKELIKVREESIARTEDHLKTVQERYDKGYASEFDVLRVKVQLANAKPPLTQAKNLYQLTMNNLKNILGISLTDSVNLEGTLDFEPIEVKKSQAEEFAFKNRSELKSIFHQRRIGQEALVIAKATNKPNLLGSANYEYKRPFYSKDEWETDWNFTFLVSVPIFDGFLTRSKVRQARSDLKQLSIAEKQIGDLIKLEISQAVSDLNLAKENILSQEENVKQAKESLRIAKVQYQQGMITNLEQMDTELALTVAQTNYLQALADYLIAKAKYEKAIGKD